MPRRQQHLLTQLNFRDVGLVSVSNVSVSRRVLERLGLGLQRLVYIHAKFVFNVYSANPQHNFSSVQIGYTNRRLVHNVHPLVGG